MKQKLKVFGILFFLFASFLLQKVGSIFASSWSGFKNNQNKTAVSTKAVNPPLTLKWQFNTNANVTSSPIKYRNLLIYGTRANKVVALDAFSGDKIWEFATSGWVESTPLADNGKIFVGSVDGILYSLNSDTGEKLWEYNVDSPIYSSPVIYNSDVCFSTGFSANKVLCLNVNSGQVDISFDLTQPSFSSPAIIDNTLIVGANDGIYRFYDLSAKNLLASFSSGGTINQTSTAIGNNKVFALADDFAKTLYALDLNTKNELWHYTFNSASGIVKTSSPVYADNKVFVTVGHSAVSVYAFKDSDGTLLWSKNLAAVSDWNYLSTPAYSNGTLYVASMDGKLYALNANDGSVTQTFNLSTAIISSIAIASGNVFAISYDGNVYAYEVDNDNDTPAAVISSPTNNETKGKRVIINGTVSDEHFKKYVLSFGSGASPSSWTEIATKYEEITNDYLATWNPVSAGNYTVKLTAYDVKNNSTETTVNLNIDLTPPTLVVNSPEDNFITNNPSLIVSGKTDAGVTLTVQGQSVSVDPSGIFFTTITLSEGINTITVYAKNSLENDATITRSVTLDTGAPTLTINSPPDNLLTNNANLTISGTAEVGSTLIISGQNVVIDSNGNFSYDLVLNEGSNAINFQVVDKAGNIYSTTKNVTLDTTPPVLTINQPQENQLLANENLEVKGSTEANAIVKVNNEQVLLDSNNNFSKTLVLQEGENTITISGVDLAGNTTTKSIKVVVDTEKPNLQITSPENNTITNNPQIQVNGNTDKNITVTLNGNSISVNDDGTFTTTYNLAEGENTLTFNASDNVNNTTTISVKVILDTKPPVSGIIAINNNEKSTSALNVNLSFSSSDNEGGTGIDKVKISNSQDMSNAQEVILTNGSGSLENWQLKGNDGGKKIVYAVFYDKAGNSLSAQDDIVYDPSYVLTEVDLSAGKNIVANDGTSINFSEGTKLLVNNVDEKGNIKQTSISGKVKILINNPLLDETKKIPKVYSTKTELRSLDIVREFKVYDENDEEITNFKFNKSVKIMIPYTDSQLKEDSVENNLRSFVYNETSKDWELVPGEQTVTPEQNTLTFTVEHFSLYRVIELLNLTGSNKIYNVIFYPNPYNPLKDTTLGKYEGKFYYQIPVGANVTKVEIKIYNIKGTEIKKINIEGATNSIEGLKEGENNVGWDGTDSSGKVVANGVYIYQIKAENINGDKIKETGKIAVLK